MAGKPGFFEYVSAAFNARPFGMVVAPNWVGIAAMGLLGIVNPGFWVLGAGLELGYLMWLSTNSRFQRVVDSREISGATSEWDARLAKAIAPLGERDRVRYQALANRCRSIIELQVTSAPTAPPGLDAQHEGLGRLSWTYLRLLLARQAIEKVLGDSSSSPAQNPSQALASLERRLKEEPLKDELRRSLEGQLDILRQRVERRGEAGRQMTFIDAELARIEQQIELIREQAALSTDPEQLSQRIDEIAATLGSTSQWIRDQRQVLGAMDDLLTDVAAPNLDTRTRERE
jgi:hypothetical protein